MKNNSDFKSGKKPFSKDGRDGGNRDSFKKFKKSGEKSGFDKPYGKPAGKPFEKPFGKPFGKPAGKPTGKPAGVGQTFEKKFAPARPAKPFRPAGPVRPVRPLKHKEAAEAPPVAVAVAEREDSGMVYGRNAVLELLKSGKTIDKLFIQSGQREGSISLIFSEALKNFIPVLETEKSKLDSMINSSAHQGVIAMASAKEYCSLDDILQIAEARNEKPFILIADKIMDPHNLGAIIRTAECAGVHGMIIPKRNAAGVSPIVAKISAGASVHMAIAKVANIAGVVDELKKRGVWIFSSALDLNENQKNPDESVSISDYSEVDYDIPLCLIVGNEGEGLAPLVIQKSDFLIKIPMFGKIDSLNVSCACAVLAYEISRQRKRK
ncbi:MAG: 23S rRNA (guanosine(2251)-2'-O)-methyltransferase RlmB [Oscillospiraceae bacterium]|nr:23S rRNA (guanosine(2251)-2'-O)-methyltransferase RlmB [Oscillospiraceae bacterium]